jgi:hypothetical protein
VRKPPNHKCEYPGCEMRPAKRVDIPTNWFRGDDVSMLACREHRKENHHAVLLRTDKAQRQIA